MELVALISTGKGSWGQVAGVINREEWDNIIIIGTDFAKKFTSEKDFEFIEHGGGTLVDLKEELGKTKG